MMMHKRNRLMPISVVVKHINMFFIIQYCFVEVLVTVMVVKLELDIEFYVEKYVIQKCQVP